MNRRYELLYNSGITFLHAGRPLAAFDCLIEALQIYHCNARLWLRIAECCVAANKGSSEEEMKGLPSAPRKGIVQDVIGTSNHRKIVLTSGSLDNKYNCDGQSAAMPVATLQFAAICLNNALSLLQEQEAAMPGAAVSNRRSSDSEHSQGNEATKANVPAGASAPPGAPLKQYEVESLKCSILANSAYVCLGLGDVLTALEHSINLLNQPKLSGSHKFLGHLYAAEALVSLDKISDAISHLSIDSITDVSVTYPGAPEVSGDKGGNDIGGSENSGDVSETPTAVTRYFPASIQSARATFLFNLSTSYSLRSEYDKARRALQQACSLIPASEIPQQALILAVYLELQNGNFPLALQMVKKNQLLPYAKMSDSRHGGQVTPTMGVIGRKSVRK
ncbi:CCR4-NOT transcription complex subunit 10-like [Saccoglossus kowalevskii]